MQRRCSTPTAETARKPTSARSSRTGGSAELSAVARSRVQATKSTSNRWDCPSAQWVTGG